MRYRKLRIAWSVFWGLAAVLLIVLWVRSYWENDSVQGLTSAGNTVLSTSWQGRIQGRILNGRSPLAGNQQGWRLFITPTEEEKQFLERNHIGWELPQAFSVIIRNSIWNVTVAHWLLVIVATTFTVAPYIPWSTRFSLRTLLIVTTLIAVALGLIVWLR